VPISKWQGDFAPPACPIYHTSDGPANRVKGTGLG